MANAFKNKTQSKIGTALTPLESYTVPAATETTVIGLTISNTELTAIEVDACLNTLTTYIQLEDQGAGNNLLMEDTSPETFVTLDHETNDFYIVKGAPVPAGGSLVAVGGDQKVVLMPGDTVKCRSNTELSADVIMSVLEIT